MHKYVYLLIVIVTIALIRILPVTVIRKKIDNRFIRSFLYYVPYVTLAVMTFPSIIQTTPEPLPGIVALTAGVVAAWRGMGLFPVAALCCVIVYLLMGV